MEYNSTMRRPLLYTAMAFAAGILIPYYFNTAVAAGVIVILAVLIRSVGDDKRNRRIFLMILLSLTAGTLDISLHEHRLASDPALSYLDETVEMVGVVKESARYTDSKGRNMLRIRMDIRRIEQRLVPHCFVLVTVPVEESPSEEEKNDVKETKKDVTEASTDDKETKEAFDAASKKSAALPPPGTILEFTGTPKLPPERRNPNCFDYRLYLRSCGIQATVRSECLQKIQGHPGGLRGIETKLFLMKENYLDRLSEHAGLETSAMLRGILFGEKDQLSDEIQDLFRQNGTAHILAVSGLHVGMIYAAMLMVWDMLSDLFPMLFGNGRGKRFFCCCIVFFLCYMFLAGYTPSVVRAVCMVMLHAFAGMTGRRYDLSSAAFAVGTIAMLHNPYIIFQAGFQMSFLAILTLGLVCPYIHRVYDGVLVGSIAVQIGLGPYILWQFNTLSLIAVFINVPVIMLSGVLVPTGMLGMLLPAGTGLFDCGLDCLCRMMLRMNELAHIDHLTYMTVASPPVWVIATFYISLLVFASEEGRLLIMRRQKQMAIGLATLVLLVSMIFGHAADDGFRHMDMVFVDVGQGDCMYLRSGSRNYLIDGGGSTDYSVGEMTLRPYLLKNGVSRIDGAFVTHLHTDHYQGICDLAKAGMVRRLYVYEANRVQLPRICEETGLAKSAVVFLRQGQTVRQKGPA